VVVSVSVVVPVLGEVVVDDVSPQVPVDGEVVAEVSVPVDGGIWFIVSAVLGCGSYPVDGGVVVSPVEGLSSVVGGVPSSGL
jgi:hypothetical protein